ncbi:MAG: hypothetical protein LBT96_05380 [Campylobacteraceae bacterium]|jgi:hypothetical protein|nr:hypothetical protein [Campylobacteraceae bacterium]
MNKKLFCLVALCAFIFSGCSLNIKSGGSSTSDDTCQLGGKKYECDDYTLNKDNAVCNF